MSRLHGTIIFLLIALLCAAPAQTPIGSTTNAGTPGTVPTQFSLLAWPSYVPTTTNLTSVTSTGYGVQNGKTAFYSFYVTGTGNGSTPTIGLPFTAVNLNQMFSCMVNNGVTWIAGSSSLASTTTLAINFYNGGAPSNGTVYIFSCEGVFQTT